MNPEYQTALDGTLRSTPGAQISNLQIWNVTDIPLRLFEITADGQHAGWNPTAKVMMPGWPGYPILPSKGVQYTTSAAGMYYLLTTVVSGAFVSVVQSTDTNSQSIYVGCDLLTAPNDIGLPPTPHDEVVLPPDSPSVVVGCGSWPPDSSVPSSIITREQYWQRLPESYSLAPGDEKLVQTTVVSGMQDTSSDESTVSASVEVSVHAGWGPVSASVSASLSSTSTTFHQVTATSESTHFTSFTNKNLSDAPVMVLYWQLTNVITMYDPTTAAWAPQASIIFAEQPFVIGGPYNPTQLEAREPVERVTGRGRPSVGQGLQPVETDGSWRDGLPALENGVQVHL